MAHLQLFSHHSENTQLPFDNKPQPPVEKSLRQTMTTTDVDRLDECTDDD